MSSPLRAIMVAVDYADLLAITLPYNIRHFKEVWIITDHKSAKDVGEVAWRAASYTDKPNFTVLPTELFTANGAAFNKWAALEEALDLFGRHGWICLMDADVLWPKDLTFKETKGGGLWLEALVGDEHHSTILHRGQLCTPLRRMWNSFPHNPLPIRTTDMILGEVRVPGEQHWADFPLHRNVREWAGYSQIFHADDPVLRQPPWHQVDWRHAGGADSAFQARWPLHAKVRPPFECLHLGEAGINWLGRATPRADGSVPEGAEERRQQMTELWRARRRAKAEGGDRFAGEKL